MLKFQNPKNLISVTIIIIKDIIYNENPRNEKEICILNDPSYFMYFNYYKKGYYTN